eukprot:643864-Pyramimonas_sp.AAC.1
MAAISCDPRGGGRLVDSSVSNKWQLVVRAPGVAAIPACCVAAWWKSNSLGRRRMPHRPESKQEPVFQNAFQELQGKVNCIFTEVAGLKRRGEYVERNGSTYHGAVRRGDVSER